MSLLLFGYGCKNNSSNSIPGPQINTITITPSTKTLVVGGEGLQLTATLRLSTGEVVQDAVFTWQSDDSVTISVNPNGLVTANQVGVAVITASSAGVSGTAILWARSANLGAASLSLSGKASYEDREFNQNGFTGVLTSKPIRNAVIEVIAIDGFVSLGTSTTNGDGDFSLTVDNSQNSGGVFLKVFSKTDVTQKTKIEIKDNKTTKEVLWFISPGVDDSVGGGTFSATQNLLATAANRIGGAFNIMDVLMDASVFVQAVNSCLASPFPDCVPPLVTVYWEPGSTEGTFYDDVADAISLLGSQSDSDEYDDSVIIHEYGHFIVSKFLRDDSPGGFHTFTDNDQDIRLSWSEGWANFFSLAMRNSPVYLDTFSNGALSINMEDYTAPSVGQLPSLAIFTTSEISVSGILWDLFDGVQSSGGENDPVDLSFTEIFHTFLSFPADKPTTLETFWTQFSIRSETSSFNSDFQTLLQGREVELFADASEAGLNVPEATLIVGSTQHHTLYLNATDPVGDIDVISFNAASGSSYTVNTFNLSNGADPFLTIKNPSGVSISTNDNPGNADYFSCGVNPFTGFSNCPKNDKDTLAASITFTAAETGTFTVEVMRSENAPPSAGLLGAYDIQLTLNP